MSQLNSLQKKILDSLTFVESFQTIVEESGESEAYVGDELKTLIDKRYVQVMEQSEKGGDYRRSVIYDSDNMRDFYYRITHTGLKVMEGE